jgi:hypothetical protein
VHHRRTRSVRDQHTHCTCNLVLLCWRCHVEVHGNPTASRRSGWIVSSFMSHPSDVLLVVERHHRFVTWQNNCTGETVGVRSFRHLNQEEQP